MVYYPDIKRSEVLLPAMAWMNLKSIMQKKKKKKKKEKKKKEKKTQKTIFNVILNGEN